MPYTVLKNFYVGNDLHSIGETFESDNAEQVAELVADGNIGEASATEPTSEATANDSPLVEPPVASGSDAPQAPVDPTTAPTTPPVAPPVAPQEPNLQQIQQDAESLGGSKSSSSIEIS